MSKEREILNRFGANLAESMGAGRTPRAAVPGAAPSADSGPSRHDGCTRLKGAAEIRLDRIAPDPNQPRTDFDPDAITRLADSLTTHGQLQPITVRWSVDMGRYVIVTGERRWRAATQAGRITIAAVVLDDDVPEPRVLELQLIENCLREDLRPVEQARAFRALMDRNGWTAARLAEELHLTGASVSRSLALLDLPYTVQESVDSGDLAPSVAYEVSKLDDANAQAEVASRIVAEGLSREEAITSIRGKAGTKSGRGQSTKSSRSKGRGGPIRHRAASGLIFTVTRARGNRPVEPGEIAIALKTWLASLEGDAEGSAAA